MIKKVLVTGIDGFIGRHTIPFLNQMEFEVHGISRKDNDSNGLFIKHAVNLLDTAAVEKTIQKVQPTHLLHLAWYTEHGKYWNADENLNWVGATCQLVKVFVKNGGIRAVIAGSCAEYEWRSDVYKEETAWCKPATLYGVSKNACYEITRKYAELTKLSIAWGRVFFTFGPGENSSRLVPYVINSLIENKTAICKNGNFYRDFIYVKDVARLFTTLLESNLNGAINIGSGHRLAIKELVIKIAEKMKKESLLKFEHAQSSSEPDSIVADVTKLNSISKGIELTSLEQALDETIEWWTKRYV